MPYLAGAGFSRWLLLVPGNAVAEKQWERKACPRLDTWVGRTGEIGELRGLRKDPTQSPFIRLPTVGPLPSEGICLLASVQLLLWLPLNWTTDSLSRRMDSAFSLSPTPQLTEKLQLQRKLFLSKVLEASVLSQWQKAN